MGNFAALFTQQAAGCARYRPQYPEKLFDLLCQHLPDVVMTDGKRWIWDAGTGNGQAAVAFAQAAERIEPTVPIQIVATDPSAKQLQYAVPHSSVVYQEGIAEKPPVLSGFDVEKPQYAMILAAQAAHWFDLAAFAQAAAHLTTVRSRVVFVSYHLVRLHPIVDRAVDTFYQEAMGAYWDAARHHVETGYQKLDLAQAYRDAVPTASSVLPVWSEETDLAAMMINIASPQMSIAWAWEDLLGYLQTWSSLQMYRKTHQQDLQAGSMLDPLDERSDWYRMLHDAWQACANSDGTLLARWQLSIRIWQRTS